jgi:hypothetical protein
MLIGMKQFSLRRLFASVTIVAIGLAVLVQALRFAHKPMPEYFLSFFALWFLAGPMIGAGIALLFKRPKLGAVLGFFFQVPTWIAMIFILRG